MEYCICMGVRSPKDAIQDILDEMKEFIEEPSMDEFSDIMFGFGRLLAGMFGKEYVRVPGDRLHVEKINARMVAQGCIRSERKVAAGGGCV